MPRSSSRSRAFQTFAFASLVLVACANGGRDAAFDDLTADGGKTDGGRVPGTGGSSGGVTPSDGGPPASTKVLINEIQTEAASGANAIDVEFVELFNPGSSAVSLGGYTLRYRSASNSAPEIRATFAASDTIEPGGHFVVGSPLFTPRDAEMLKGLKIGGAQLGLLDASESIVDRVGWGATTSGDYTAGDPAPMAPAGQSIARKLGSDTGKNDLDFEVATSPTPGAAN